MLPARRQSLHCTSRSAHCGRAACSFSGWHRRRSGRPRRGARTARATAGASRRGAAMTQIRRVRTAVAVSDLFCLYPVPQGTVAALRGLSLRVGVASGSSCTVRTAPARQRCCACSWATNRRVRVRSRSPGSTSLVLTRPHVPICASVSSASSSSTRAGRFGRARRPRNVALQMRLGGVRRRAARSRADDALSRLGLETLQTVPPQRFPAARPNAWPSAPRLPTAPRWSWPTSRPVSSTRTRPTRSMTCSVLRCGTPERRSSLSPTTDELRGSPTASYGSAMAACRRSGPPTSRTARPSSSMTAAGYACLSLCVARRARRRAYALPPRRPDRVAGTGFLTRCLRRTGPWCRREPDASGAEPAARLKGVRVAYGSRVVLDAYELDVRPATLTVIRGRSGSGKSTILRVLLGLSDPDEGQVLLGGVDLSGLDRTARADLRREVVAVSGQGGALAEPLDVEENLASPAPRAGCPTTPTRWHPSSTR